MGRFFKSAVPTFVQDNIIDAPIELMKEVLGKHDDKVDKANDDVSAFTDLMAEAENLAVDNPQVEARLAEYRDMSDELAGGISGDVANYQKYLPKIRQATRQIKEDMDRGLLGKATEQHTKRAEIESSVLANENIDADHKKLFMQYMDGVYKEGGGLSYDPVSKTHKAYNADGTVIAENVDSNALINTMATNFKADTTAEASAWAKGGYLRETGGTKEYITEDSVKNFAEKTLEGTGWDEHTRQKAMLEGYSKGLRGQELKDYEEAQYVSKKQDFIDAAAEKLGYTKLSKKSSIGVDQKDLTESGWDRDDAGKVIPINVINQDLRTDEEKADWTETHKPVFDKMVVALGGTAGDYSSIVEQFKNAKVSDIEKMAKSSGLTLKQFQLAWNNYSKSRDLTTPAPENIDEIPTNKQSVAIKTYQAGLSNAVESYGANQALHNVAVTTADGKTKYIKNTTTAELAKSGYISLPLLIKNNGFKKVGGFLVDANGNELKGPNGESIPDFKTLNSFQKTASENQLMSAEDKAHWFGLKPTVDKAVLKTLDNSKSLLEVRKDSNGNLLNLRTSNNQKWVVGSKQRINERVANYSNRWFNQNTGFTEDISIDMSLSNKVGASDLHVEEKSYK